jgi:hypothetical protein
MKALIVKSLSILLGASFLLSCDPEIDTPTPTTDGKINLQNYIAIGNSLTAGYASNGLYLEGQKVAYPVLMAQQFKLAGGGEFNAPLFTEDQRDGTGYLRLDGFLSPTSPILTSVPGSPNAVAGKSPFAYNPRLNPDSIVLKAYVGPANQNWGVPGIRVADIYQPGYGFPNSYFGRLLPDAEKPSVSYAAKVSGLNPTFFSCWLGNNDVLGFSTSGGYADLGSITNPGIFSTNYSNLINSLTVSTNSTDGVKGVVANIPDVTSIPFFTTVTPSVKSSLASVGVTAIFEFKFDSISSANKILA